MMGILHRKRWCVDLARVFLGVGVIALISGANLGKYAGAFVQVADVAAARSRGMNEDALLIECRSLIARRNRAELYDVASCGYRTFHTNEWRYLYGMACAFRYEDKGDSSELLMAERLFHTYAVQIPYDPRGHTQWGWCLSHLGRRDEARREFLKALALDPNNQSAKNKLRYVMP